MAWIWTVLATMLLLSLLQFLLKKKKKKKNFPPGPAALPILGHFHLIGDNPHHDLHNLARKHGPIMGLHLGFVPVVVVSSPAAAALILKTHDAVFASRPRQGAAEYMSYEQRNIAFGPYGPYWREMRKLCTMELLTNLRINQFQALRKREIELMLESLRRAARGQQPVDLSETVSGIIGDMNCLMIFGRKFADKDLDEKVFKAVFMESSVMAAKFNLADYFPYIGVLDLQGLNRKMRRLAKIFDGFLEKIIDDHDRNKTGRKQDEDFVDIMLRILESGETSFEFDRRHIKAVLLDLLVAGMDTSSTAVEWTLSELIRHPKVMKKLQNELELVVGKGHQVEESHLEKLEYLDCVLKETQRLHPVAPLLIPHESIEDCIIDNGFHIPKKSRILVNVWAIGRDPNVWHDPETFYPERFIGSNIDLRGRNFELIPFGAGRRSCPGLQLGLTIVRLMVAQLVHCFDWELPNGMKPADLDMSEHFGLTTARAQHLKAIPSYRFSK